MSRHIDTCPDVIHMKKVQRQINNATIGAVVLAVGGLYVMGWWQERKAAKNAN